MPIEKLVAPAGETHEEDLKDPALAKIRDLIYRMSGIFQTDNKFYLLANRCQRRMSAVKSGSFADYLEHLTTRPNRDAEMRALLNEITIGETCFFRNQPQLDAVTQSHSSETYGDEVQTILQENSHVERGLFDGRRALHAVDPFSGQLA